MFPNDVPFFYRWLVDGASRSLSFLKSKPSSELVISELPKGESKIVKPQETAPRIDTLDEALALDSLSPGEEAPQFAEGEEIPLSGISAGQFTLIENRLSVVETSLAEQKALTQAELRLQKKTILGTLETLIGISKLLPSYPISTIVVQGQPATLTSYSISPSVHSGFDRLSANYFNLANNAEINGSLTVRSGGTFNTLSVSGATSLSGNTTIGGTLNVSGDTTLNNLTVNGSTNISGGSFNNASTTYFTVSDTGWINQLKVTGTATTTFNNPITSASGNFIVAGDSASNILINPYGGNIGIGTTSPGSLLSVHSSGNVYIGGDLTVSGTTNLSGSSFSSTNASTTNLTVAGTTWINNAIITNASSTNLTATNFWSTSGTITTLNSTTGTITNASTSALTINFSASQSTSTTPFNVYSSTSSVFSIAPSGLVTAPNFTATTATLTNASSTYLSVSDTAWINKLVTTNATTTTFRSSGLATFGGNVGIGTTSPGSLLSVHSSGNVYIGGDLTVSGTTNLSGSSFSSVNASTTNLTVAGTAWINNGVITNASTTYATLPTFWGTTGIVTNASSTNLTGTNFWSTNGTITNASSTYLTVSDTAWFNNL